MTTLLYPQSTAQATACPFFSAIPRAALDLRRARGLLTRDIEVLALLLDYKRRGSSEVSPRQTTLAGRLGCSLDTIQRSVRRLMEAGLLAKTRRRDGKGRAERCVYDLAATLSLMPVQAARLRHGAWGTDGASAAAAAAEGASSRPHGCGVSKADEESVVEADNSVSCNSVSPVAVSPVVRDLTARGVFARAAQGLVERFGERRCRAVLSALASRPSVRDKPAWLVAALRGNWTVAALDPPDVPHSHRPYAAPHSHRPYAAPHSHRPPRPPLAAGRCARSEPPAEPPLTDPLAGLSTEARAALERQARDALLQECTGPVLALLRQGRERRLVQARMRAMAR